MARARARPGLTVRWIDIDRERHELVLDTLARALNERTRLVCVGYASNVLGTVNDVRRVCERAREVGALVFVDAVHYAPHGLIDVQALGCDLLVCSAYKFFGTHQGILWGRRSLLEDLRAVQGAPGARRAARVLRDRHAEPRGPRGRDAPPSTTSRASAARAARTSRRARLCDRD